MCKYNLGQLGSMSQITIALGCLTALGAVPICDRMPPKRRGAAKASPKGPIDLPDAIWENIAGHLSTKGWAKASGTCRKTSALQLQKIDIPKGTLKDGVSWVMKRLGSVETLRLRADCAEQLVRATGQGSLALKRLQHLMIEMPEEAAGNITFVPMLAWLLSRADNLQLLSANIGNICFFPPMSHLKHLALNFTSLPENRNVFDSVAHAVSLETLMFKFQKVVVAGRGPILMLDNLKNLQRLALKGVVPAELQVWETCSVSVEGSNVSTMSDDAWSWVAAQISYLRFVDHSSKLLGVPASFAGFNNLQVVCLVLKGLGGKGASVSLQGALANIRRLSLQAHELFITVPAEVKWEEVLFVGDKALSITFVDVDAFAANCPNFATYYASLIGTWMPNLCKSLAAQGIEFEVMDLSDGNSVLVRGWLKFTTCFCGACLKCLALSNKAVSDWAT